MNPNNYTKIDEDGIFRPQPMLRDGPSLGLFGRCIRCLLWKKLYFWTSIVGLVICIWMLGLRPTTETVIVHLKPDAVYRKTSADFLSLALDTSLFRERWIHLNITSPKFLQMTKYLSPGYLRIGGTAADRLIFHAYPQREQTKITGAMSATDQAQDMNLVDAFMDGGEWAYESKSDYRKDISNLTMTGEDLLKIYNFSTNAGFKLLFDLNVLLRDGDNWDSSNAIKLFQFSDEHKLNINWQLGNEPNSFPHVFNLNITGDQLGRDFEDLKYILTQFPRYKNSLLVGPDITRPKFFEDPAITYLSEFLGSASNAINAISWHQYYLNGRTATTKDFLSPSTLNVLYQQTYTVKMAIANANLTTNKPLWLSETGSAYGGGAPALSDRFIAGFLWLDKLGVAARMGIDVVIRQSLYHGHYSLLEEGTLDPLPDWWLSVVYKTFVGPRVIKGTTLLGPVRMYCHCTPDAVSPTNGTVTLYGINVLQQYAAITLKGLPKPAQGAVAHAYILTSEDGLSSKNVSLNGERLALNKDGTLPPFKPRSVDVDSIYMPPLSIGFFVLHGIEVPACQQ